VCGVAAELRRVHARAEGASAPGHERAAHARVLGCLAQRARQRSPQLDRERVALLGAVEDEARDPVPDGDLERQPTFTRIFWSLLP
jgi:hypothetical protein